MKCSYSVTLEFETQPPLTAKGTVQASSARTSASRAVDETVRAYPGKSWRSLVVVLERIRDEGEPTESMETSEVDE